MYSSIILSILSFLFWPIAIIVGIVFFVKRNRKNSSQKNTTLYSSKEYLVSQALILLSFCFMWVTLLSIDKQFGNPISWKTILIISVALVFAGVYYFKVVYALPFVIYGFIVWWIMQAIESNDFIKSGEVGIFSGVAFFSVVLYCLGRVHEIWPKWKRYAFVYFVLGLIQTTFMLFLLSTKSGLEMVNYSHGSSQESASIFVAMSSFLFIISIIGLVFYAFVNKTIKSIDFAIIIFSSLLFIVLSFISRGALFEHSENSFGLYSGNSLSASGFFFAFIVNIVLLAELLGIVFLGYLRKESWMITIGAIFLFIFVFVKYVDWFFSFMDKSVFFIIAGLLLLGLGWAMEKGRKKMIASMNNDLSEMTFYK